MQKMKLFYFQNSLKSLNSVLVSPFVGLSVDNPNSLIIQESDIATDGNNNDIETDQSGNL